MRRARNRDELARPLRVIVAVTVSPSSLVSSPIASTHNDTWSAFGPNESDPLRAV